jgi:hypothetical protein
MVRASTHTDGATARLQLVVPLHKRRHQVRQERVAAAPVPQRPRRRGRGPGARVAPPFAVPNYLGVDAAVTRQRLVRGGRKTQAELALVVCVLADQGRELVQQPHLARRHALHRSRQRVRRGQGRHSGLRGGPPCGRT